MTLWFMVALLVVGILSEDGRERIGSPQGRNAHKNHWVFIDSIIFNIGKIIPLWQCSLPKTKAAHVYKFKNLDTLMRQDCLYWIEKFVSIKSN